MTGWLRTVCVASVLLVGCGGADKLSSVCVSDADCGEGASCSAGVCIAAIPGVADAGTVDPGSDLSSCADPCGSVCCTHGTECHDGACVAQCVSGVWCGPLGGEVCCGEGQRCSGQLCVDDLIDPTCPDGEVYDPGLEKCAPPVTTRVCQRPETGFFEPEPLWQSEASDGYDQVITTPVVIDLDGDGAADVVAPFFSEAEGLDEPAVLRALSGIDGHVLWETPASLDGLAGTSQLAAARLSASGPVTIVGVDEDGRLSAFRGDTGQRLWRSRSKDGAPAGCNIGWGAPAIADLDGDVTPEIVCGFSVFSASGVLRWAAEDEATGPLGPIVALADLDGDGHLDLTDGTRAYRHDGKLLWAIAGQGQSPNPGLAAVADLVTASGAPGRDGVPEVVVTRHGSLELREGTTGALLAPVLPLPAWSGGSCTVSASSSSLIGGAPAVGDLDGDGVAEVVVASGECLAAISVTAPTGSPQFELRWGRHAVDASSAVTSATLFDFDGDGRLDVVHADETVVHVLEGSTGAVWYEAPHCSGTVYEEPVVADVDGDGSAEVVLARNGVGREELGCDASVQPGIAVLRERQSRWANARPIWNQHGYVVPDVCDGQDAVCAALGPQWGATGRPAIGPVAAWSYFEPGSAVPYNAARANTHGAWGATAAADAEVSDVLVDAASCPSQLGALVRVVNHGEAPLRPGTLVRIEAISGNASQVATAMTTAPIPPGGSETLKVRLPWAHGGKVTVDVSVDSDDRLSECDESNNVRRYAVLACP